MLIIEVDVGFHAFGHPSGNEPLDRCLFLGSDPLFLSIMSLPFGGEEIRKATQPLTFSLNLSLPLTETMQPMNVSSYTSISYGLYGMRHHIVHLEALSQQIQIIPTVSWGNLWSGLCMEHIAINGSASSQG